MSRRSSAGWGSNSPSFAARPRRRGGRSPGMRTRSSDRRRSWPTWTTPRDVEPLRRAVRQARKAGDLDARLAEARGKLARAEKKAATALAQLPGWSRSAEDLQCLAVPLDATLDQFESRFQDIDARAAVARRAAGRGRRRDPPARDPVAVPGAPARRADRGGPAGRAHAAGTGLAAGQGRLARRGTRRGQTLAAFLAEFAPGGTLASAYEQSVQRGDELADRLRREADRVARKAEWLAQLDQHRDRRTALEQRGPSARRPPGRPRPRLERAGRSAGRRGPGDGSPVELRAWLRRREEVLQLLEKRDEARQGVEPLEQDARSRTVRRSRAPTDEVGEPSAASGSDAGRIAGAGRGGHQAAGRPGPEAVQAGDQARRGPDRAGHGPALAPGGRDRAGRLANRVVREDGSHRPGSRCRARAGRGLPDQDRRAAGKAERSTRPPEPDPRHRPRRRPVRGGRRGAGRARRRRTSPIVRPARPPASWPAACGTPRPTTRNATTLTEQRQREEEEPPRGRDPARGGAGLPGTALPGGGLHRVRPAPRSRAPLAGPRPARIRPRRLRGATARRRRGGRACSPSPPTWSRPIPTRWTHRSRSLEAEIAAQEDELRRVDQTIGAERGELAGMDSGDGAAESAEKAQTLLARLQGDIARYATLKLAAAVLHRSIERYREKNQGPILARPAPVRRPDRRLVRPAPDRRRRRRPLGAQGSPARRPAGRRRRHERRLARPALPRPAAGQPGILAPVPRADPVHRRRHPAELRRPPRHRRARGPGRALAADPGPLLHPPSPHDRPGPDHLPRDVVFVHELPCARSQVIIPTSEDFPAVDQAGRSSRELAQ